MNNTNKQKKKKPGPKKLNKIPIPIYGYEPIDMEQCAQKLEEWAYLPMSYRILDFCDDYKIKPDRFYDWCKISPLINDAKDKAVRTIARRLMHGSTTREYESATAKFMACGIDRELKEWRKEEALERRGDDNKDTNINVYMDSFPLPKKQLENS